MGTGLGLAQVYGIVKQHGGAISVTSVWGQGTTFTIYLPLVASESETDEPQSFSPATSGDECILLVEDNADLRDALAQSLESLGYRVLSAPDATMALELASQMDGAIDLVLSDMVLPGWSGVELFRALEMAHPRAQLIVMTGHPMNDVRMESMQQVHHWIQKPFTLNSLTTKVRMLLDKQQEGSRE
jgi:CheY-like chemotaxis protein